MSTTKPQAAVSAEAAHDPNERVRIRLPKDNGRYRDDVYVSVNGRNALIKRGVTVDVPRYIACAIQESMAQDERTAMLISSMEDDFSARSEKIR